MALINEVVVGEATNQSQSVQPPPSGQSVGADYEDTSMSSIEGEWLILEGFVRDMIEGWRYKARVDTVSYTMLVLLYASMILVGATGNLLVILVVVRNAAMRTARNVFIVNLAVSDLMLCLITMPLTLVEILYQTWQFGNYPAACPVAAMLQGTSIFVSTLSITAIALDRRQLIVCPHKGAFGIRAMLACVPVIWGLALALASPMAIWKKLEYWNDFAGIYDILNGGGGEAANETFATNATHVTEPTPLTPTTTPEPPNCSEIIEAASQVTTMASTAYATADDNLRINCMLQEILPRWLHELQTCKEDFPDNGRIIYSAVAIVIQYLLPTITISVAYYQIYGQLKLRMQQKMNQLAQNTAASQYGNGPGQGHAQGHATAIVERIENDILRMRRTTNLLIWVGVIFCVCWLPINILNVVMDITEKDRIDQSGVKRTSLKDEHYCIIYAVCHVTGMLSACANPVIYGYLNENFNREFKDIFATCFQTPCALYREWRKKASGLMSRSASDAVHNGVGGAKNGVLAGNLKNDGPAVEMRVLENGKVKLDPEVANGEGKALLTDC